MPIISFWGTENSAQLSTTATMTAVAAMLPIKHDYKTLMTQTHYGDMSLESAFFNMDKLGNKGSLDIADTGVDALDRLLRSNKLTPEIIPNYAKPIIKGRLELLYGTFKNDKDSYERVLETMPMMVDYSSQLYDLVFVDLNRGYSNAAMTQILQKSDLIVLTMSQKWSVLKKLFKDVEDLKIFKEKPIISVIGRYDRYSKYNTKNIARTFQYKKPIYCIPYNTQFFDACNEGKALEFFAENMNADIATDRNGFFISEVNKIADEILESLSSKLVGR